MRKIYLFLVLACCGLVACEASLNPDDKLDPIGDPAIVEMEALIAEQNGEFDDKELLDALYSSAVKYYDKKYLFYLDNNNEWKSELIDGGSVSAYTFHDTGELRCYVADCCYGTSADDPYVYYISQEFNYDADSNTLTTTALDGSKLNAKVLYFKDDVVIIEGNIYGKYSSKEYVRYYLVLKKESRDEFINSDIPSFEEWIKMEEMKNK